MLCLGYCLPRSKCNDYEYSLPAFNRLCSLRVHKEERLLLLLLLMALVAKNQTLFARFLRPQETKHAADLCFIFRDDDQS